MEEWRCASCNKLKPLSGNHLIGKTEVRSDCWPCGKKCTFIRNINTTNKTNSTPQVITAPFLFNSTMKSTSDKSTISSTTNTKTNTIITGNAVVAAAAATNNNNNNNKTSTSHSAAAVSNPFLTNTKTTIIPNLTDKNPFASTTHTQTNIKVNNPFLNIMNNTQQQVGETSKNVGNNFSSSSPSSSTTSNTTPIVMHSVSAAERPRQSPPFTFTTSPNVVITSSSGKEEVSTRENSNNNNNNNNESKPMWRCASCGKVKPLSGDHLNGKTEVRSDCWPCGKKRTFILSNNNESCNSTKSLMQLPHSMTAVVRNVFGCESSNDSTKNAGNVSSLGQSPIPNNNNNNNNNIWRDPVIPENDSLKREFYVNNSTQQTPERSQQQQTQEQQQMSVSPAASVNSAQQNNNNITIPLSLNENSFEGEVLRGYRQQLVDGIRTRTAWSNQTLYVLAPKTNNNNNNNISNIPASASNLGAAAVVFLTVEHKIAQSPFRRMRRLFCPNEFTFAAACMYANIFLNNQLTTSQQSSFIIYGPRVDHTIPTTRLGDIIENCPHAQQCVVSGEQRVEGAQSIFKNTAWLTLPLYATAEGIRLMEVQQEKEENKNKEKDETCLGVDVVLVEETVKLLELQQAVGLALPVKLF